MFTTLSVTSRVLILIQGRISLVESSSEGSQVASKEGKSVSLRSKRKDPSEALSDWMGQVT